MRRTYVPMPGRLLIKEAKRAEMSPGLTPDGKPILIPESVQKKEPIFEGEVIATAHATWDGLVKRWTVGDVILYGRFGGTEVTIDGETFKILHFSEVLGVLEPERDEPRLDLPLAERET